MAQSQIFYWQSRFKIWSGVTLAAVAANDKRCFQKSISRLNFKYKKREAVGGALWQLFAYQLIISNKIFTLGCKLIGYTFRAKRLQLAFHKRHFKTKL